MGLPHILVRFYTNPDGPAARRTTVRVLGLLGIFYLFPTVYGLLGRVLAPGLYVTGETDSVVLRLPHLAWPGSPGNLLSALTPRAPLRRSCPRRRDCSCRSPGRSPTTSGGGCAGARTADAHGRRQMRLRSAAALGIVLPVLLALAAGNLDIGVLVGWAFALAASTFCPMFLLGIWWEGLTARGAALGMIAGAGVASGGIFAGLISGDETGAVGALLAQPAVVSVPIAFVTMTVVSLLDSSPTVDPEPVMLALHAPEGLGLEQLEHGAPAADAAREPAPA